MNTKFQLIIKNIESNEYTVKEVSFKEKSHVIQYFKKYWSQEYFEIVEIVEMYKDNIELGDMVEVIHADGEFCTKNKISFIGKKGIVIEIDRDWDYPYLIKFLDKDFEEKYNKDGYLWKMNNLRLV